MGNKTSAVFRVLGQSDINVVKRAVFREAMEWPFTGHLPRPLQVGDKIEIEGIISQDTDIFTINLVCEHDLSSKPHNVAYHHKMIFSEGTTILNSKHEGTWQEEENHNDVFIGQAFVPGEQFNILLMITEEFIVAYFDGVQHSRFQHRLPIQDIRYLQIWHGLDQITSMKVTFAN